METKTTLIVEKGAVKIQTESKHSSTVKKYVGELDELFFGDNRLNIDEIIYNIDPKEQSELDTIDKDVDKAFTTATTQTKETSNKKHIQKRKSKFDTFIYRETQYIKVENMFIRVFPDDFCEKVASSTYYKYQSRYNNEA